MKNKQKNCDLESCSFCRGCLPDWRPAIAATRKTLHIAKGEILFKEEEKVTGIYYVYQGAVKVHKKWGEKELIVRFAKNGDIVGHRGLGSKGLFPVSATAIQASQVCFIDIDFFLRSLKVNHDYLFQLMMFFAEELRVSERKMRNLAHMPVKGRVAQALLTLRDKFGVRDGFIDLALTRQDLASYTGATYETVFRVLNDFVTENLVRLSGKKIGILNDDKLTVITNLPE